jgi:polyphosphate glucokinase
MRRQAKPAARSPGKRKVLVVDVGGSHVKIMVSGRSELRRCDSGPALTAAQMVRRVKALAGDWKYDVVSIGFPGPVVADRPAREPHNLGKGWVKYDYAGSFGRPVRIINDAAMQALGGYAGGKMLFLGFGTGLGSTLIVEGVIVPMEIAHLPYRKATFEDYVGEAALERDGKRKWRRNVADVIARLIAAFEPADVVLGGGNARILNELPPRCRLGENANAFPGGIRMWAADAKRPTRPVAARRRAAEA